MRLPNMPGLLSLIAVALAASVLGGGSASASAGGTGHRAEQDMSTGVVGFNAGNIISDEIFFQKQAMSAGDIQSFLNGKVPRCEPGYTCLKDFAQSTTTRQADAMCTSTYEGRSRQTAAEIIYYVAQACGINPQVLLVTLQKEQGLVTHVWPSDWRYTIAMGQGCPDTADCDSRYYGFFNQVYGAAWQLKRYANPPGTSQYFTWYAPGRTWNIRYNPDAGCGSSPVAVANQATANLYYYTPYQPNAAALMAGYGEGDGCSAYGNRNFYNYFTDWFGSTQSGAVSAIAKAHANLGGATGPLGPAVIAVVCGLQGGGCFQEFQGGAIYSSPSGTFAITGAIRSTWSGLDYERGLGYPVMEQICGLQGGGCFQEFQGGAIYSSPSGTFAITGAIRSTWSGLDYERGLGYPVMEQICGLQGGGCFQEFQGGAIYSSPSGTFAITGAIRSTWSGLDYERGLGYPVMEQICGLQGGGCFQEFQGGAIYSSPSGTFAITGAIRSTWSGLDYERGLGYPVMEQICGLQGGGCFQEFQGGAIYSSPSGTFAITGAIRSTWSGLDYERGLGYPTTTQSCGGVDVGCTQSFERGTINWTQLGGAVVTNNSASPG